ncbi:MAG: hypothetical protein Q4E57_11285 [Eubacteriales bacterium]|nr:hypothetical protein [Eubacteriales bacterium]
MKFNENETIQNSAILNALSQIYFAMAVMDLKEDTFELIKANMAVEAVLGRRGKASDVLVGLVAKMTADEDRSGFFAFTDFDTISERIGDKDVITYDYTGITSGWSRAAMYPVERDENGLVTKIIFACRMIHEEDPRDRIRREAEEEFSGQMQKQLGIIEAMGNEYELLLLINASTKKYELYRADNAEFHCAALQIFGLEQTGEMSIDEAMSRYIDRVVYPEDRDRVHFTSSVDEVFTKVPETGIYSVPYRRMINLEDPDAGFVYYQANYARFKGADGNVVNLRLQSA